MDTRVQQLCYWCDKTKRYIVEETTGIMSVNPLPASVERGIERKDVFEPEFQSPVASYKRLQDKALDRHMETFHPQDQEENREDDERRDLEKALRTRAPQIVTYEKPGVLLPKFEVQMDQDKFELMLEDAKDIYDSENAVWTIKGNHDETLVKESKHRTLFKMCSETMRSQLKAMGIKAKGGKDSEEWASILEDICVKKKEILKLH